MADNEPDELNDHSSIADGSKAPLLRKEPWQRIKWERTRFWAHLTLSEVSGAFGDLGTLLPILVALSKSGQISLSASLIFGGIFNIITGFIYRIPMCVQPMKAIAAVALSRNLSAEQVSAAGILVSSVVLLLGVTNAISLVYAIIPKSVIRGLQFGTGGLLGIKGVEMISKAGSWAPDTAHEVFNSYYLSLLAFLLVLVFHSSSKSPSALLIFAAGLLCAFILPHSQLSVSPYLPSPKSPSSSDFLIALTTAALGQLPLTLLNSVIAVSKLADDLYPTHRRPVVGIKSVAVTVGLMNLVGPWFGSVPYCHGSGGLAAQHRFGARSEISILLLGIFKISVGLLFGESLVGLLQGFPSSFLGVMLLFAGLELCGVTADVWDSESQHSRRHFLVFLVTAVAIVGFRHDGLGVCCGLLSSVILTLMDWYREDGVKNVTRSVHSWWRHLQK